MARWMPDDGGRWPPRLATFDPAAWPPAPDEVEESCACTDCRTRFGPPGPAPRTVAAARRRWRRARLATLTKGTDEYRTEALSALRENLPQRYRNPQREGEMK